MKIRSIFYHLKQGFKNIYRNRLFSLASIATITACVFLFGDFPPAACVKAGKAD